jgi:hypothetical protein
MNLWDKISSLIAEEKKKAEPEVAAPAERSQHAETAIAAGLEGVANGPAPLSPAEANTVLSMLPKGQALDQFSAGQIQLLNIESVRADLGDRWNKYEHQVHLLVEATLRRMLSESDIFTQIGEYEYLVIFPNLTEQKASALMYVAAAQIRQKLFGHDPAFAAIRLNATVTHVTRDLVDKAPDAVLAAHEAALLGQPAQAPTETPDDHSLTPPVVPWTDKYKIVPIEPGTMTKSRMVADAGWSGKPQPDFSSLAEQAPGGGHVSSAETEGDTGSASGHQPAEGPGYPVFHVTGAGKPERRVVKDEPRPVTRMPDFSSMRAGPPVQRSGSIGGSVDAAANSQENAGSTQTIEGYRVFPITRDDAKEARLVQDAPRSPTRVPDFSRMNATSVPTPGIKAPGTSQGPTSGIAVDQQPALVSRLDALAAKASPVRAVPITRPTEASAGSASAAGVAEGAGGPAPVEIEELQLLYEPIWDVQRQAVTAYRMKISLKIEGALLGLNEFCLTYDDPRLQSALNSAILRKLGNQVQAMRGDNKRAIIVAPIGRRFIEDQSSLRLLIDQLSVLNDQERQLVVLEIGDVYFGSWPTLTPRIAVIRRVCRNIGVRISLDHKDFQQVAATGSTMVAGDLSDHDWPERQTLGALNEFATAASKASLRSFIGGLTTSSTVIAAVGAGLNHISGSAIGAGVPRPMGVYPLSTEGFYLQRQTQRQQPDQSN